MLERIQDVPAGVDAVNAVGAVSKKDYETVIEPLIDEARREGRRLRFLYEFGPEFRSFTPGAGWEDMKVGLGSMRMFEGCALVSDIGHDASSRPASFSMARTFGTNSNTSPY